MYGVVFLGILVIGTLLYYLIGRGKNWARITFLILFVMGLPSTIWSWAQYGSVPELAGWIDVSSLILSIVQEVLQFVALVFLFRRASSEWFKAIRIHSQQLRTSA